MSLSKAFALTLIVICLLASACSPAKTILPATAIVSTTPQKSKFSPIPTLKWRPFFGVSTKNPKAWSMPVARPSAMQANIPKC